MWDTKWEKMFNVIVKELTPILSEDASITREAPPRWSTFAAPNPATVVHVACEQDVAETVQYKISQAFPLLTLLQVTYCKHWYLPFAVQNGGHGWARWPETGALVLINLSRLNKVTVAEDKKTAVIGGGAKIRDTVVAADAAGVIIQVGNCNAVGALGSALGGGYVTTLGMFGFGVDSILELRVVTSDGELRTVSATQEPDLFWAMRGAGPNFGIVTSATVKAHIVEQRTAWAGALIFTPDKLEEVVQAIQDFELSDKMMAIMYFASGGPPEHAPMIVLTVWMLHGDPKTGRAAFKPFFDVGPVVDTTSVLPYLDWNTGADPICAIKGKKPAFHAGVDRLDPKAWREVWNHFAEFQKRPGAEASAILLEIYPMTEARFAEEVPASFPHRGTRFQAIAIPMYEDAGLDEDAIKTGKIIREIWQHSSGKEKQIA